MPPLLSQSITPIIDGMGPLSPSSNGSEYSGKTMPSSKKKSKQKFLIASSPPHCVSSTSLSSAASVMDVPGGLSTSSDESSFTPKVYIDVPAYLDICCGRGKGFFNRPGNKLFQDTIKENAECYRNAKSKSLKSAIVTSLVKRLTEQGARFVKKDPEADGRWYVLSQSLAHEKTGHAIRDHWTQRQHQAATAIGKPPLTDDENVSQSTPNSRTEPRKKTTGKKRLHKKSIKRKVEKTTSRRAINCKSGGKRGKKETIVGPPEKVENTPDNSREQVLVVDSLPKLGMRHFHDVENGSISTISSCPHDDHLESFDLFEESPPFGEHHVDTFPHNGNTEERENLSHVVPASGLWSQPPFLPGDDANESQSQNIHVSHQQEEMPSLVEIKNDTMITQTLMYNNSQFPQHASQSELMQSMSKDDPSIMDSYFMSWSLQQQDFLHTFGSSHFVESNPFMPNPLVIRSPILQMGFTGNMMNS